MDDVWLTVFWRALIEYHACYSRMLRTLLAFCEDPSDYSACTHPTPREFFLTCPRTVLYIDVWKQLLQDMPNSAWSQLAMVDGIMCS